MSVQARASQGFRRIEDPLLERAVRSPDQPAVVEGDRVCSYGELAARARALAAELRQRGLVPGDRVAVFLDKTTSAVVALYATWLAGAVAVPVNEGLRSRQVEHIVSHSGSRLFISDARKLGRLEPHVLESAQVVDVDQQLTARGWEALDVAGGVEPAAILYTSGSTGKPKGILISHANLLAGARIVARYLEVAPDERILSILPFSFDYGLNQLLTSVGVGATLFLQRSHAPSDIQASLGRFSITGMAGVPPLWLQLLGPGSPLLSKPWPHLRYVTNSGGALPTELIARWRRAMPSTRIYLMYGLSEAFRSTYLPPDQVDRRPGSIGRAIPETEILVMHETGRACGPGEVGELVHRGPTVALGYWRDPDATAAVFRDSPFASGAGERVVYSGDLVHADEEGFLYFAGRRDALLKCQGFRVSAEEVEEILHASGMLVEAAACGVPDPVAGQVIVAHVVPREPRTFSEDALLAFCRREMPSYMVPRAVRVHASLPRTASGKLDRKGIA